MDLFHIITLFFSHVITYVRYVIITQANIRPVLHLLDISSHVKLKCAELTFEITRLIEILRLPLRK